MATYPRYGYKTAPHFVKLSDKAKQVIRDNKIRLVAINNEIEQLFKMGLDPAGLQRKALNHEKALLQRENADIRKGFRIIADNDPITDFMNKALYNK